MEVLGKDGLFIESTPLSPNSPYSSSKASADMMALSFHHTYESACSYNTMFK